MPSTTCACTSATCASAASSNVGVAGISLGGYTAALLAAIDERLSFCIPIVPGVSPIDAFLEWQPTGLLLTRLMQSRGIGIAEMRSLVAVHNPLTYASRIDGERVLIVAGAGEPGGETAPCSPAAPTSARQQPALVSRATMRCTSDARNTLRA